MVKVCRLDYPCGCQLAIEVNDIMQFRSLNYANLCMKHIVDVRRQVKWE